MIKAPATIVGKRIKKGWFFETALLSIRFDNLVPQYAEFPVNIAAYHDADKGDKIHVSMDENERGKLVP